MVSANHKPLSQSRDYSVSAHVNDHRIGHVTTSIAYSTTTDVFISGRSKSLSVPLNAGTHVPFFHPLKGPIIHIFQTVTDGRKDEV